MLTTTFQIIGVIASFATIAWFLFVGGRQISDSLVSGVIVQAWWELALDPMQRRRFRRDISVGLRNPNDWGFRRKLERLSNLGRDGAADTHEIGGLSRLLAEPWQPLNLHKANADGVYVLRLLIYNPSGKPTAAIDVDGIDVGLLVPTGVRVLSWQANDGRLSTDRKEDHRTETLTDTITLPVDLRSKRKVRDELVVLFDSRVIKSPPPLDISVRSTVKSKVKLYRPAVSWRELATRRIGSIVSQIRTIRVGLIRG